MSREPAAAGRQQTAAPRAEGEPGGRMQIRLPAEDSWLAMARSVAFSLGVRAELDIDAVEDLKMAVDEACARLVRLAPAGAEITGDFQIDPDAVRITLSAPGAEPAPGDTESFGWHVLSVLTDELSMRREDTADGGGPQTVIRLARHHRSAHGAP